MKTVALTFDDGREDNYSIAYPIMKHYGLVGTIFVTTGYIDGTWEKDATWLSAEKPLTIEQLIDLKNNYWEIGLHGDRHKTSLQDTLVSIEKMDSWIGRQEKYGFSMPNSISDKDEFEEFVLGTKDRIKYIRCGRKTNTKSIKSKILYGLYRFLGSKRAYFKFNRCNVLSKENVDIKRIYSVVIRKEDNPYMILKFIDSLPEDSIVVFMLHSIIEKNSHLHNIDPWCWDSDLFKILCKELNFRIINKKLSVNTLANIVEK